MNEEPSYTLEGVDKACLDCVEYLLHNPEGLDLPHLLETAWSEGQAYGWNQYKYTHKEAKTDDNR